ncbi:SSI family serine proteinase inhibitor [Streptomyces sp. MJP52]|nr:SSI family serine proteinase inhibitor [Streptomyces sp. MJP52]MDH6226139.1 hypothetical protein [Streptomyces sp. MJP52]
MRVGQGMPHVTSRTAAPSALSVPSLATGLAAVLASLAAAVAPAAGSPLGDHELRDRLTVTVRDAGEGRDGTFRLRCHPHGGDHPDTAAACARLDELSRSARPAPAGPLDPFAGAAPASPQAFCTMVDGGPATARITGWWDGRRVRVSYDRRDGCRTARWDAMVPVLPRIRPAR